LRLGEADLGERDRVRDLDREAERGVNERRGDPDRADRGRLCDLVGDRSRIALLVRDGERAGDGERDGMSELI
jgi:cell division cycle 2-like protein